jgi:hypothetical protein
LGYYEGCSNTWTQKVGQISLSNGKPVVAEPNFNTVVKEIEASDRSKDDICARYFTPFWSMMLEQCRYLVDISVRVGASRSISSSEVTIESADYRLSGVRMRFRYR